MSKTETGIDEKTKNKIIAIISALIPEAKIYLFGSRARGKHSEWSDVDLALDSGKKLSSTDVGEIIDVLKGTNIPFKIEVVDMYAVSGDMRQSIEDERVIWKN